MIRVLAMIAVAGFVLSVGCIAAAVAIGGPDAVARAGWGFADGRDWGVWSRDDRDHWRGHRRDSRWVDGGDPTTRTLAWSGSDRLDLDVTADVRYIQTPGGPGVVEVTGPGRAVAELEIAGDTIRYADGASGLGRPKLTIIVRAPNIARFDVGGVNSLEVEGYRQPRLSLDVSGDGEATVAGETDELRLEVAGNGEADLGRLKTKRADVEASGASDVTIAPSDWARLEVSGMGDIRLLTRPAQLETDISGAGKVRQDSAASEGAPPTPPAKLPVAKGAKT
jgi:hypothetical protein